MPRQRSGKGEARGIQGTEGLALSDRAVMDITVTEDRPSPSSPARLWLLHIFAVEGFPITAVRAPLPSCNLARIWL